MNIKKRYLPPGWYPASEGQTRTKIESFLEELGPVDLGRVSKFYGQTIAGVIPHAGWEFSGRLALDVMRRMDKEVETIVVVGGHLGPSDGIYASMEEGYETPLGIAQADLELLGEIKNHIDLVNDTVPDNTVEVQLPFLRYLFPKSRVLAFRAPPSKAAEQLGKLIWEVSQKFSRKTAVLGSTDLTHYGDSYGFAPHGYGEDAVRWVKEINDKRLIDSLVEMKAEQAIELALTERSACSVGAAVSALIFAKQAGIDSGEIVSYATSWDVMPSSSFVGYVGVMYS